MSISKKEFENGSRFMVETKNEKTPSGGDVTCYNVEWTPGGIDAYGHQETPFDCFDNYNDVFCGVNCTSRVQLIYLVWKVL